MPRLFFYDGDPPQPIYVQRPRKSYGFLNFVGDIFMTVITGGFWLLWVFVREMRRR